MFKCAGSTIGRRMRGRTFLLAAAILAGGSVGLAADESQTKPQDQPCPGSGIVNIRTGQSRCTIQEAIDRAKDGDEIVLQPGTYTGNGNRDIDFRGKAVTVRGVDPHDPAVVAATIIDCQGTETELHRGFNFHSGEGSNSVVAGLTITNGCAPWEQVNAFHAGPAGGAILCDSSSPTIRQCRITNNMARAAAIYNAWGDPAFGGGICCLASSPRIVDCEISDNSATGVFFYGGHGGGVYSVAGSPVITNCTITDNAANLSLEEFWPGGTCEGGGICCDEATAVSRCTISGNVAGDGNNSSCFGGGVSCTGSTTIRNCTITGNTSVGGNNRGSLGGGVFCEGGTGMEIADCVISGNWTDEGGGIYCLGDPAVMRCTIVQNHAEWGWPWGGGGICCSDGSATIDDNAITDNTAYGPGGGVFCSDASPTIANNTISGNSAAGLYSGRGGGIYCDNASPTIENNTIAGNRANDVASGGGGILWVWSSGTIADNTITGNMASYDGGGISWYSSSGTIANNTIAGNGAAGPYGGFGGGISCSDCSGTIVNTIVAFNSSGIDVYGGSCVLRYNCVHGNTDYNYSGLADPTGADGNTAADPGFVSVGPGPDGVWGTSDDQYGDLRLLPGSPCIDAGSNADVPAGVLTDLGGYPRFLDDPATTDCPWAPGTCGTPPIVDIGAHEFAADGDGDGVPDFLDNCPASDLRQTVVINGVDTGVPNQSLEDGCTMADEIAKLAAGAANHGSFVGALDSLTDSWVSGGLIAEVQKGRLQSAAGHSSIPGDINGDGFVDASDLLLLAGSFGKRAGEAGYDSRCDLNADGAVDVSDRLILAGN
jgi:parallel beta-helix repeat protein